MSERELDELGRLSDRLESALAAVTLPLPPQMHIEGLSGIVSDVRDELRAFVIARSDHNPWE